jgi:cellulose synthase/poly-beta-1,6-N-acetylglucosamine synthase-like glycosyltransferase
MQGGASSVQSAEFAELIVASGLVTPEQLEIARAAKAQSGAHIDETLIALGMLDEHRLLDVMAVAWGLEAAPLAHVDAELVRRHSGQVLLAENWLPVRTLSSGQVLVATARVPDHERAERISAAVGAPVVFGVATSWDIKNVIIRIYGPLIADEAANELWKQNPDLSARQVLSRGQKIGGIVLVAALIALLILWPAATVAGIIGVASLTFLIGTGFKFFISMRGARFDVVERISAAEVARLTDAELPRYTVLVPVFHEENIVAQLVANLGQLDWPVERLEVLVLIEEEDTATRAAFEAADPPAHFHVVTVPAGEPQTKPRACNVGLFFATGEFVVIYDAEDTPDPDQLKKAYLAFRHGGAGMACVQASLNYFNANENALTRMFTLEYSYWFDYMLAGLDAYDLPIPLGGTSNHFRTSALVELGGWDPYNVTEDADLGIRSSALGYRVGVINSTTMEEANTSIPNFVRQRSRWIKGYLQTTLVHARRPRRLLRQIGLARFLSFALLIGGTPLTFLAVIPFSILTVVTFVIPISAISAVFPVWVLWLCLLNFIVGNVIMIYLSMMGPFKRGTFSLILWSFLNPAYWLLHSIAAYKGLWQLITRPHYWEKTAHGLTTHVG